MAASFGNGCCGLWHCFGGIFFKRYFTTMNFLPLFHIGKIFLTNFVKKFHTAIFAILYALGFFIAGKISQKNKQDEEEIKNVKVARKVEENDRNLTREQLVDKL